MVFFTLYGCGGHLVHVTQIPQKQTFITHTHGGFTQNFVLIGQVVWEEKMFEIVDDGRTTEDDGHDHVYTTCISSPDEPLA